MNQPPLNPDALEVVAQAIAEVYDRTLPLDERHRKPMGLDYKAAQAAVTAYLAVAQPEVNSVAELDALPIESVVLDDEDDQFKHVADGEGGSHWVRFDDTWPYRAGDIFLPARVLYRPEVNDGR